MKLTPKIVAALLFPTIALPSIVLADMMMHDPAKMEEKMEERSEMRLEKMTKELKLTPEQQTSVRAALDSKHQKMMTMRQEMADKMKAAHEETETQIDAVLTPEQKTKYAAMKEKMKNDMKEKHHQMKGTKEGAK